MSRNFKGPVIMPVSSMTRITPPRITYGRVARMNPWSIVKPISVNHVDVVSQRYSR